MGFSPPVPQDDSNWEIRVAVLLSLFLQMLLIFVGPVRKRSSAPFLVWSCYLLADWVADLALGLMLNNMGNIGGSLSSSSTVQHASGLKRGPAAAVNNNGASSSPIVFAFWTPFLLLHLGGPDTITAYSMEDNELWLRHLIGLLFELFSAFVIFFCSLKSNPMVPATVLMFFVGIVKYGERTYSLYSGSVDGFREKILDPPDAGPNYAKLMTEFDAKEKAGLHVEISIPKDNPRSMLDESERDLMLHKSDYMSLEAQAYTFFLMFRRLFVNLILSYNERKISQAYILNNVDVNMSPAKAFEVIEVELNFIYDMVYDSLYTKAPVAHTKLGCVFRFLGTACIVSSLFIFFHGKAGFLEVDVAIIYALLLGGVALDVVALLMLLCSHRMIVYLEETLRMVRLAKAVRSLRGLWRHRRWSERTSQLNLISYCLGKPDDSDTGGFLRRCLGNPKVIVALAKVADALRVREIFDDFFFIRRERIVSCAKVPGEEEPGLLEFVFNSLKKRAENAEGKDMKTICGCRGEGVLDGHHDKIMEKLKLVYGEAPAADEVAPVADKEASMAENVPQEKSTAEKKMKLLKGSVAAGKDFDESLLLWHIATDLCFYPPERTEATPAEDAATVMSRKTPEDTETSRPNDTEATPPENAAAAPAPAPEIEKKRKISKTLSEYMLYLLIKHPELLSATAGIGLLRFRDTRAEAQRFFESAAAWDPDHKDARRMLLAVNTSKNPAEVKGDRCKSVLFDGVILAKTLRDLDEALMWEVVAEVWGEMLTYAAGKCLGSTHVKQLSRGGELIAMVWFLMAHMGLGDMYKIHEGDAGAKLVVHDQ